MFLVGIGGMGYSFKLFGKEFSQKILEATSSPLIGLFIGLLGTTIVQSSSTSTSIIIGMVAAEAIGVRSAIFMVMGANIGTTVTAKLVSLGHITRKAEFRRAFAASSVHDTFNLITVGLLYPLEYFFHIVEHVAIDQQIPTLVFSCEMSAQQIVQRLLFSRARYSMANLRPGLQPTKEELSNILNASKHLKSAPLFIDDTPAIPIGDVRAKARRKKRDSDIGLIAVDYLQLMRSQSRQAEGSREREIAEISAGLKALAKELNVPVIVLAQLNRGPEQRGGAPRMSDLRESGSLEQDADLIGLLYRQEYYNDPTTDGDESDQDREASQGKAELIIAKNRNGPTGNIELTFLKELMRFETRAPEPHN